MQWNVALAGLDGLAERFWKEVRDAKLFAFEGGMGAGKTTIISALCKAKGVQDAVSSPTFSIINEYRFRENEAEKKIYHIDLYRLKDDEEIMQAGVEDCIYSGDICFVEWPEKAPALLKDAVRVCVSVNEEGNRQVEIHQ